MLNLKGIILLTILILMICSLVRASELVIHLKNGEQVTFALEQKPIISFETDDLVVKSENTCYSVSMDEVACYDFNPIITDVENRQNKKSIPIIFKEHIVFTNLSRDSKVFVYTMDGKCIHSYKADSIGNVDVNLNSLPKGICILKSSVTTIKITIK